MDERDHNTADLLAFEPPGADDIKAVAAFYERTGVMPINSIGPPIDRPIIPSRRPDRVGDFAFTTGPGAAPPAPKDAAETEDSEAEKIRQEYLHMLDEELKGL